MMKKICILALMLLVALPSSALAAGYQYQWGMGGGGSGTGTATLSASELEWLVFMREEEKLARDTYLAMYAKWKMPVFANIASSEQRHMDAVKNMLDKYGIPDPALSQKGKFTNAMLQNLYLTLIAQGSGSKTGALNAGVAIEERDISDLDSAIAVTQHSDILNVYTNIRQGSYNHLAAFRSQLAMV